MKWCKWIMFLLVAGYLAGCASGSKIITGEIREPTIPEQIQLITELPQNDYYVIGLVNASSDNGFTEQGKVDYATEELKKQAASVGANAIILQTSGKVNTGFVMTGNLNTFAIPVNAYQISGQAIYIFPE